MAIRELLAWLGLSGGGIEADELGATPAAPPTGRRRLYAKVDGWYERDSAGSESRLRAGASSSAVAVSIADAQTVAAGYQQLWYEAFEVIGSGELTVDGEAIALS